MAKMASKGEPEDSMFIQNVKRMKICSDNISTEEDEGDGSESSKSPYGKGKLMAAQKECDSGSARFYTSWLTLKAGSCIADGTNKHIYEAKDAENRGTISSSSKDSSNKRIEGGEKSVLIGHIPEEILTMIFCKLLLHTLFQMQIVSRSWKNTINGSDYFHNLWEQSNVQRWLVLELYDLRNGSSNGLIFYDVGRTLRYKTIFNEEWICNDSQWFLRAGEGGLLVYSCKRNGTLKVVNPLTMQSHYLEDASLTRKSKLSYYLKKYCNDVAVQINSDPKKKTYEVTVIIGNLILLRSKKFIVLIYRSTEERWEIRDAPFERSLSGFMTISFSPSIFVQNRKIYWFPKNGSYVFMCDLNGDGNIKHRWIPLVREGILHHTLGVVMCKGSIIMVCKGMLPPYTNSLMFYEFDELNGNWRFKHEAIVPFEILIRGVILFGGDYIWVYASQLISIDIDSGELKTWPSEVYPFVFNVKKCLSMPLSFWPCS